MKKLIVALLISMTVVSCNSEIKKEDSKKSQLTVTTNDSLVNSINIMRPLDGVLLWGTKVDTITKNKNGVFEFEFPVEKPLYANLKVGDKFKKLILLPNQKYTIDFKVEGQSYSGDNAKGQELYNSFFRPPGNSFTFINKFYKDTTATQLTSKIKEMKSSEMQKVDSLFALKAVDERFYEVMVNDINYYYAAGIVSISDYRLRNKTNPDKEAYEDIIVKTKNDYPYTIDLTSPNWSDYVLDLEVRGNNYGGLSREKLMDLYGKDSLHIYVADRIKKNVKKPYEEKVLAHYLFNEFKQKQYEKSLINLYNDFESNYPESQFLPYLNTEAQAFRVYHQKAQRELSENVTFIENKNINSLKELLKEFNGEKLYIDMWATWCAPCKKEFESNDNIKNILSENNYKKLYISLDKAEAKDKWIDMIKYYDLAGYHHLASQEFFVDFEKNHSTIENSVSIPQYLMINKKGEILTNNAPRPSKPDELKAALKKFEEDSNVQ